MHGYTPFGIARLSNHRYKQSSRRPPSWWKRVSLLREKCSCSGLVPSLQEAGAGSGAIHRKTRKNHRVFSGRRVKVCYFIQSMFNSLLCQCSATSQGLHYPIDRPNETRLPVLTMTAVSIPFASSGRKGEVLPWRCFLAIGFTHCRNQVSGAVDLLPACPS